MIKKYKDWRGQSVEAIEFTGDVTDELLEFCPQLRDDRDALSVGDFVIKQHDEFKFVDAFYMEAYLTEDSGVAQDTAQEDPYIAKEKKELLKDVDALEKLNVDTSDLRLRVQGASLSREVIDLKREFDELFRESYAHIPEQLHRINFNCWRIPAYEKRSIRKLYPIKKTVALVCASAADDIPRDLVASIEGVIRSSEDTLRLYPGNKQNLDIIDKLAPRYAMLNDEAREGEELIDHLVSLIPETTEALYNQNAYLAAQQVFDSLYPNFNELVDSQAEHVAKNYTQEDNINVIMAKMSIGDFFQNKIDVWKELNITPTVAKVKMLANKELSDKEAESILRTVNATRQQSTAVYGNKYTQDVTQRAYLDNVKSAKTKNEIESKTNKTSNSSAAQQPVRQMRSDKAKRKSHPGARKVFLAGIVGFIVCLVFALPPGAFILCSLAVVGALVVGL
jgi:hypothetical protein